MTIEIRKRGMYRPMLVLLLGLLGVQARAADAPPPWASTEVSIETGLLWQVGVSTPLSYRLVPTQVSWRPARGFGRRFAGGAQLLVRPRIGLLATWIQQGPESHYFALHASPSIELWSRSGRWGLTGGAGGGFGWLDSQDVVGGQGQDATRHWFGRVAVEHVTSANLRFSIGAMFQHMSNGGATNPNPGIDALGFTFGATRTF